MTLLIPTVILLLIEAHKARRRHRLFLQARLPAWEMADYAAALTKGM